MRRSEIKNTEWALLIVAIILSIIGIIALFSATQETEYDEFKKQIIWFVVSIIMMVIVTLINYETLVIHSIANSSTIHQTCKWSNKLV